MKKVLAITFVMALCLCVISTAMADEDNWRFYVSAATPDGLNKAPAMHVGVYSTALDGVDAQDQQPVNFGADLSNSNAWAVSQITGDDAALYGRNIQSPDISTGVKTWTLYVAAGAEFPSETMDISLSTLAYANYLPPATVGGEDASYSLRLTAVPEGVTGAPAVGTTWDFAAPTAVSSEFLTVEGLPTVTFNYTAAGMMASGYQFELTQSTVVPEPSSMLALGSGLMGLVGFAIRRRRA